MAASWRAAAAIFAVAILGRQCLALSTGANADGKATVLRPARRVRAADVQLHEPREPPSSAGWEHLPPSPRLAIVTGGTPDVFGKDNFGAKTLAIMLEYAQRHGYALYVDRNLRHFSGRGKGWNKIRLMQQLLSEAPVLAWMDADIVLRNLSIPLDRLLSTSRCDAAEQSKWERYLSPAATPDTFLWLSADMTPNRYLVNVNTGVMILRRTDAARQFLEAVWGIGDDPRHFEHHSDPWAQTSAGGLGRPERGWPWEQGAVWDVLAAEPAKYLRAACVVPMGVLQSVRAYQWSEGQLAQHCSVMSDYARTKVASFALRGLSSRAGLQEHGPA
mmetsp:Transcript_103963/g.324086  ORF Transcript_103963/g.324086 Transcript_103963/m.324086 type:complete len:331 (+) Transcript_103963:54-1046(+)